MVVCTHDAPTLAALDVRQTRLWFAVQVLDNLKVVYITDLWNGTHNSMHYTHCEPIVFPNGCLWPAVGKTKRHILAHRHSCKRAWWAATGVWPSAITQQWCPRTRPDDISVKVRRGKLAMQHGMRDQCWRENGKQFLVKGELSWVYRAKAMLLLPACITRDLNYVVGKQCSSSRTSSETHLLIQGCHTWAVGAENGTSESKSDRKFSDCTGVEAWALSLGAHDSCILTQNFLCNSAKERHNCNWKYSSLGIYFWWGKNNCFVFCYVFFSI